MASEYQQTTEKKIQDRVRSKYKVNIDQLKALHFEEFCFISETLPALGLSNGLFGLLGVLAALPFEVSRIGGNLSASAFFPLMVSREYDTYVSPLGLGTKFYTSFSDGTCVITANFASQPINDDDEKLYKLAQPCSIEAAWQRHQVRINDLTARGKQRKYQLSFDEYAKLARKEDNYMLKAMPFASVGAVDIGSAFLSTIILACFLAVATLIFLFLPNIVHTLYPACEYVKGMGKPTLPQSFLIVCACIVFSWLLARVQKNAHTLDGIGTAFHGNTPSPDARGYIATKWLVFMFLPLLPVRSYQIEGKYSKFVNTNFDSMQPLHELHWDQVRETLWRFKWWYVLVALLWIGVGAWSLLQCM